MNNKTVEAWDKTARNYFQEVLSPFAKGVSNPIFWYIENKVENSKSKRVLDLGTGIGNILPFLSKEFKEVVAIDISEKMIEIAKRRTSGKNIQYLVRDARNLEEFHSRFDAVISVNSILSPKIIIVEKILSEIYKTLNDNGVFIAVFPSMDALIYRAVLEYEKALEENKTESEAFEITSKAIEAERCDFVRGTFRYNDMVQKHYYRFELKYRLWKAGFKNVKIRKVYYPWEIHEEEELLEFKGKPELWDWFVYAEKRQVNETSKNL